MGGAGGKLFAGREQREAKTAPETHIPRLVGGIQIQRLSHRYGKFSARHGAPQAESAAADPASSGYSTDVPGFGPRDFAQLVF